MLVAQDTMNQIVHSQSFINNSVANQSTEYIIDHALSLTSFTHKIITIKQNTTLTI